MAEHADALSSLVTQVLNARTALPTLHWSDAVLHHAAQLALAAGVDGVRADLVMLRAARAHAALQGHGSVTEHDVDAVAELALAHRRSEHAPPAKPPAPHSPPPLPAPTSAPSEGEPTEAPQSESSPAQGDWGAMAPLPSDTTRVASIGGWPAKKP